jgi:hypothetical protein
VNGGGPETINKYQESKIEIQTRAMQDPFLIGKADSCFPGLKSLNSENNRKPGTGDSYL